MFSRRRSNLAVMRASLFSLERLENRRFLSVSSSSVAPAGQVILFSAAPTAVETGLQTLAGSTTIPADQPVHESTIPGGTEIYAIKLTSSGTSTVYAVDSAGTAVPVRQPPPQGGGSGGTTTSGGSTVVDFSAAPTAVQTGLQTLAGSTTIPSDQPVHESTVPGGTEIYAIKLTVSGTATIYAVDSTGTAVPVPQPPQQGSGSSGTTTGSDTVIEFSAASTAVQTGLQTLVGSTTIPADQKVHENTTPDGTIIYCIKLTADGVSTLYAVDATGAAVPVPPPQPAPQQGSGTGGTGTGGTGTGGTGTGGTGTGGTGTGGSTTGADSIVLFDAAPSAVQTGLQTLAGSTTIPSNQKVHENTTPDGTTIYVIKLTVDGTPTLYAVDSTGASVPVPPPPPSSSSGATSGAQSEGVQSLPTASSSSDSQSGPPTGSSSGSQIEGTQSGPPTSSSTGTQSGGMQSCPPTGSPSGSPSGSAGGSTSGGAQGSDTGTQQTLPPPPQGSGTDQQGSQTGGQQMPPPPPQDGQSTDDGSAS